MTPREQLLTLGCGIKGLRSVQGASLILSDVPAGITRAKFDKKPDFDLFFERAWGALRTDGVIVLMASHLKLAAELTKYPHFRYDLVWEKSIATGFFMAKNRPLRSHEHMLVFYREQPSFEPQMRTGMSPIHAANRTASHGDNYGAHTKNSRARAGATDRYPTSVLHHGCVGTTSPDRIHPQQKPLDLMRWFVRSYANAGLVVDPFSGSGSTGVAALAEGCTFRGWESDGDIHAKASKRLKTYAQENAS